MEASAVRINVMSPSDGERRSSQQEKDGVKSESEFRLAASLARSMSPSYISSGRVAQERRRQGNIS